MKIKADMKKFFRSRHNIDAKLENFIPESYHNKFRSCRISNYDSRTKKIIAKTLQKVPETDRTAFIANMLRVFVSNRKEINIKAIKKFENKFSKLSDIDKLYFTLKVTSAAEKNKCEKNFKKIISQVTEEIKKEPRFKPHKFIGDITHPQKTCNYTLPFFITAVKTRQVVKTTAKIGGEIRTVYVKGATTRDVGNIIAYEPISNIFYRIQTQGGKITNIAPSEEHGNEELRNLLYTAEKLNRKWFFRKD